MKKIFFLFILVTSFVLEKQPLQAQTSVEQLYAIDYISELLTEYQELYFSLLATSADHALPSLHGFNASETTSQGWVFNNFRLTFASGIKLAIPVINLQSTYRQINLSDQVSSVASPFVDSTLGELDLANSGDVDTSIRSFFFYVPYISFSFGRLGLGKRKSPLENLLFTINYGGSLQLLNLDPVLGASTQSTYTNKITVANIAIQYAVYKNSLVEFQTLTSLGYSHSRFNGSFNYEDDTAITIPTNSTSYRMETNYVVNQDPDEATRTYLNHFLYSLQLGGRGQINFSRFGIYFQAKLLFKIYEEFDSYSTINYIIYEGSVANPNSQLERVQSHITHDYTPKSVVIPSLLIGFSILKVVNLTVEFSIFQGTSFASYLSTGVSFDIAL